jgi:hypothetical protein
MQQRDAIRGQDIDVLSSANRGLDSMLHLVATADAQGAKTPTSHNTAIKGPACKQQHN